MVMVAELVDAGMPVVDFEMPFEHGMGQVMRGDGVVIVRMIKMRKYLASGQALYRAVQATLTEWLSAAEIASLSAGAGEGAEVAEAQSAFDRERRARRRA